MTIVSSLCHHGSCCTATRQVFIVASSTLVVLFLVALALAFVVEGVKGLLQVRGCQHGEVGFLFEQNVVQFVKLPGSSVNRRS